MPRSPKIQFAPYIISQLTGTITPGNPGKADYTFISGIGTVSPSTNFGPGPYDVIISMIGQPTANYTTLIETFTRTVLFGPNFITSRGHVLTNSTASATFTVGKNGATVGTVVIATSGVFTFATTGGVQVTYNAGDYMTVRTPNPQDTTLADISWTFRGVRLN